MRTRPVLPPYKPQTEIERDIAFLEDKVEKIGLDLQSIERVLNNDRTDVNVADLYRAPELFQIYLNAEYLDEIDASSDEVLKEQKTELTENLSIFEKLLEICVKINDKHYISHAERVYLFSNMKNADKKSCYRDFNPAARVSDLWSTREIEVKRAESPLERTP